MSEDSAIDDTQHPERTAIGLVFGNSYSSIAHTSQQDGSTTVIANEDGDRQIPSILSYVAGEEYQGTQAKAQIVRNPRNTIAYFRDFLGKGFKDVDPTPCHASAHPVDVDGSVAFVVQEKEDGEDGEEQEKSTLTVAEVTTRHLRKLKESASGYLGKDVNAAVITVPSDFSDAQKSALSEAASKAGIEVLQFIAEPIAALLAHDAKLQAAAESSSSPPDKIVLVADIGGTRSDIAVVASRGGIYTTLATAHDYELGGTQLDQILIEHAAKEFQKKNKKASDPRKNERSLAKLTLEAEAVKKSLSLGATASFSIESLADGIDFSLTVNRSRFELLANKVLMSFTRLIESAVQKADLDVLDIDEILLGGGSAHTPKIASNLQSHFPESAVVIAPATSATAINPSELTARGAAIQASLIAGFETSEIASSTEAVVTVTPHLRNAIGLVTGNDGFAVVVAAETPAPVRRTVQVEVKDGGDVLVRLAEGVREISVKTEEKAKTNGNAKKDDSDEDDSDDEPEETREKVWKAGKVLAEAGIRGVKKGGKVEIQVNVAADLSLTVVCREVGGKGGVRGTVPAGKTEQNGMLPHTPRALHYSDVFMMLSSASAMALRPSHKPNIKPRRCYLLEILPELRLRIYELLYGGYFKVVIYVFWNCEMQSRVWSIYSVMGDKAETLTALLKSCKLINEEATPVLYQNLHFTICFRNDEDGKNDENRDLGQLYRCQFGKNIEKITIMIRVDGEGDKESAVYRLNILFRALQLYRVVEIEKLWLKICNMPGEADPILRTLMKLHYCNSGFEVYNAWANSGVGPPVAASEECWQQFMEWSDAVVVDLDGRPR
ncbi:Hsp70 protein that interacts with Zuo1p [Elasticomyces elasticus]|nr:Hsp70 protein that interacts with Zuo1p [Elasticomyces elasticus]KAK4906873.1 Hsp70 protein that interacts with Zuo1p [Elasticomyces elasticus]KAK5766239.1 Hsp70 protein that interacts with Zuo1p [Elasticomyces elasticus]